MPYRCPGWCLTLPPRDEVPARRDLDGGQCLMDVGGQFLIGRDELIPPRLAVAALTPGEVGAEIFGVDLPPRPVERDLVQGHALDLDDQDGLVARRRTATLPPRLVRFPDRYQQPPWGLARFHAPGAV